VNENPLARMTKGGKMSGHLPREESARTRSRPAGTSATKQIADQAVVTAAKKMAVFVIRTVPIVSAVAWIYNADTTSGVTYGSQ
jgi:hypothetical protein